MSKIKILKSTITTFMKDDPMTYAASLAFYTVVSLPAILLIAINLLSTAYDRNEIQGDLLAQLNRYLGPNTVNQAEIILENASHSSSGILPQTIGWIVLCISATTVFISLQDGLNKIWGVVPDPKAPWYKLLTDRILSFAMLVSIGFVLLVSLVIDSVIRILQDYISQNFGLTETVFAWAGNLALSLFVIAAVFSLIFKTLPDVEIKWKDVWVGGLFTSILFLFGKFFIGYYLTTTDVGSAYGASGSLVLFLFWVYYSSIIILFGCKFTYEYTKFNKSKLKASESAVFVREQVVSNDTMLTDDL